MIQVNYETAFVLANEEKVGHWLGDCITAELKKEGEIHYVFCTDDYLLNLNVKFLSHNTLTDIISFDYTMGNLLSGDIFISIDRIRDNAKTFKTSFEDELHRVMVHGVLHFCSYNDKTEDDKGLMRAREDYYLSLRAFNKS